MSQPVVDLRIDHIVTEDDTPVDNILSEKQQRLLTEPLYSSWPGPGTGGPFLAVANVGVFYSVAEPPVVPDMFLSLGVTAHPDFSEKRHRSYFVWEFGKPPDVVIEIVSNREGNETGSKFELYARMGVAYYAIYDPFCEVQPEDLRVYTLREGRYEPLPDASLRGVDLSLVLWAGSFEKIEGTWLRWADGHGVLIPTGEEGTGEERQRADKERQRADQAAQRADQAAQRADEERQRADEAAQRAARLEARLIAALRSARSSGNPRCAAARVALMSRTPFGRLPALARSRSTARRRRRIRFRTTAEPTRRLNANATAVADGG